MENLKKLRTSKNMSQQKLAEMIGVSQPQIHSYESGEYEPDAETLKNIANIFETSVDYLVGNTDIMHKIERVEKYELNQDESNLIDQYRKLPPVVQKSFMDMIGVFLNETDK